MNKIVLLGTDGGLRMCETRSQPSSALVVNEYIYMIDTGDIVGKDLLQNKTVREDFMDNKKSGF